MTPDEIERLTQREEIETFVIRFTVERLGKKSSNAVEFTHDTGRRKHISWYDSEDVARAVRRVIPTGLQAALERESESEPNADTYADVTRDDRARIAERARWAVWRLGHPDCYGSDPDCTAAKDRGLLCRLWARMLELEGQ